MLRDAPAALTSREGIDTFQKVIEATGSLELDWATAESLHDVKPFVWRAVAQQFEKFHVQNLKALISIVNAVEKMNVPSSFKEKFDEDPELKAEIKEAVAYYFHTKARTVYAELKATRAATRLGLRLLPDDLQGEVGEAVVSLFEKELGALLEKAL